jgi:glycosyltransferase involved in cell wall biosynthesis
VRPLPRALRRPPRPLRTRLLSVGPIPPEWGGRLRGGVSRFHVTLLDELRTRPWRHRVEPIGVLIPPPQRVKRWRADRRAPLPVFMQPPGGRPRRFTRLLLERTEPDVVLLNNLAAFNGARFARVQAEVAPGLPIVAIVHEWRAIRAKDDERRGRYLAAAQAGLDSIATVTFPSEHTRRLGESELGLRYPERALVIPNPLQPAFAAPIDVDGPRRGIAFVGSFNERKNPLSLLEAAASAGFELVLQGRGPLEQRLRERSAELGLGEAVRFPPYVEPPGHVAAVIEVMRGSELVCLPSRSESFGLVQIEALAAGAPVAGFAPTFAEIRDRLGIDIGEPIHEGSPEEIAGAIERIRSRHWDRALLRRAALSEFSPETIARRYAGLLRSA